MTGDAAMMNLKFILRDFELEGLNEKRELLKQVCAAVQVSEPRSTITCEINPQYRNMRYWLETDMAPVNIAREAALKLGVQPRSVPIRGGTDGSRLTEMGIPTPNLFTGMQNIHGPLEWISIQDMSKATDLCLTISSLAAKSPT
jgi:tripeptide aminopeptidase